MYVKYWKMFTVFFVLALCLIIHQGVYAQTSLAATPPSSPPPPPPQDAGMTITQTLSDGAQRNTIAFDGLAFLTGNLGADSFFPPGKVADFWGFQYLRDNDPTGMGHNTDFLTRAALNMLYVLTPAQRTELIALAEGQVDAINQYAIDRFVLMDAFRRLLDGDLPTGATGLDQAAVQAYSAALYRLDGEISYERAQVMGAQISAFTAEQRTYLDAMIGQGMLDWPEVAEVAELQGLEHDVKVAVMTYAGDMFSWYAGDIAADVYFCPERQGTYFGSFYMKDAPAVGNPGYSIPTTLTAEMGEAFLQVLTPEQAAGITGLVEAQKPSLYAIVERREDVATLLRQFMSGGSPDEAAVLSLMEDYGELDGDIVVRYAMAFAQVAQSLTTAQQEELDDLRLQILGADFLFPDGAYLYAEPISIPTIPNTDFLFTTAHSTTVAYPIVDTGQTACYGDSPEITCPAEGAAFYGQDAQITGNAPSYTDNGNGTVTDNVTGLMWQQSPDTDGDGDIDADDKLTYSAAGNYCAGLSLGDYDDWQLPNIKQLYSLIDFSGLDPSGYNGTDTSGLVPFIDTNYFDFAYGDTAAGERIIDAQYASSSLYVATTSEQLLFGVNFADGRIKGYGLTLMGQDKTFFVICARENTDYGVNSFSDNGDGTITDNATSLMWAQSDSGEGLNWEEALAWVETQNAANYLGHDDWRLPNVKELQSIVDYTRSPDTTSSAAIDPLFDATAITNEGGEADYPFYWSSTTHANWTDTPGAAGAYVAFGRALGYMNNAWVDVHGAGAQRSDPKSGDPADWPTGNGPQGDAIRIYNYVRLVRDADSGVQNTPPTAEAGGPYSGEVGDQITLDGSGSSDSDGSIVSYEWDINGDGQYDDLTMVTAIFNARISGTFTVGLRVTDDDGAQDTDTATITVSGVTTPAHKIYLPLIGRNLTADTDPVPDHTIEQTLSDEAQRNTIAFDGLAFLTGNLGADSFFPPGKVADFWGFQYLRDNDPTGMGHNTDFLTRAALNMLHVLTPTQRADLITLAEGQVDAINQYAYDRFVLMDAFRRLLEGDLPAGATGLDLEAVQAYSAALYRLDGEISYERAQVMGTMIAGFDAEQRAYLDALAGTGMLTWPDVDEPEDLQGLEHDVKVAVMTYAGDMFSWYVGSLDADVYFCPERQGTYFGSFYMKDAPAVGNPGYSIPTTLTAEMGEAFLQVLTPGQAATITDLVMEQKPSLYAIVDRREEVSTLLRQFMTGGVPDETVVLTLMAQYGELDGDIIARYAAAFAQVGQSLTEAQQTELDALRLQILGADFLFPTGAYLYAEPIAMPEIPNTDFLFE